MKSLLQKVRGRLAMSATVVAFTSGMAFAQTANVSTPEQPLATSLKQIAQQTGENILFTPGSVSGIQAHAISGQMTAQKAVETLLLGTNLEVASDGNGGLVVRPKKAQAASNEGVAAPANIETVVVIGTNIRGDQNPTAPVTTLDRAYIESTGVSTTSRLMESIPQNFAGANESTNSAVGGFTNDRSGGTSIDLRGVGEGTTLVLLNGHRMPLGFTGSAVDISALPLSALDRVEILTDGASAIYGSDAVGGVVNFVLRSDYDGAETSVHQGLANGGADETRIGQTLGRSWGTGNVLLAAEYFKRDILLASKRDFTAGASVGSLVPREEDESAVLSAHQDFSDRIEAFGDIYFSHRNTYNRSDRFNVSFNEDATIDNSQGSVTGGLRFKFAQDWQLEAVGSFAENQFNGVFRNVVSTPPTKSNTNYEVSSFDAKADGSLFDIGERTIRAAVGASFRAESFNLKNPGFGINISEDRTVTSVFGELSVPIVGEDSAVPLVNRLDLSLAGRFDDYSDFGSSFDPRIGLAWQPIPGLSVRGSYGTSFVAPRLFDESNGTNQAFAIFNSDPGFPGGISYQLWATGVDTQTLRAQKSTNWTFGTEYRPDQIEGLVLGLDYYNIDYRNIVENIPIDPNLLLNNPAVFGSLFIRNPSVAQVNQVIASSPAGFLAFNPDFSINTTFTPSEINVILDFRRRNLAVLETQGLDFSAKYEFELASAKIGLGLNGVYVFDRNQQITPTSSTLDTSNTIYNPPRFRIRGNLNWQSDRWSANTFVNYTGSYTDNRTTPSAPIASYTTIDANVSYRIPSLSLTATLGAINLFDQSPPTTRVINAFDAGFDPTNSNPTGRLVTFDLTERW